MHIKELKGKLKLTLEETQDFLPAQAVLDVKNKKEVLNISLSTMEGEMLSDSVAFRKCMSYSYSDCFDTDVTDSEGKYNTIHFDIDKPGQYIATVRFVDGEEVRYGIEAVSLSPSFNYSIRTLEEKPSAILDLGAEYNMGKHIIPEGSEKIATVTREKGTNILQAEGKKYGRFDIKFPNHNKTDLIDVGVYVSQIGSIFNVRIYENMHTYE